MNDPSTPASGPASGEIEALLGDFAGYLRDERGLASTTVENYLNQVRPFGSWYGARRTSPLMELRIQDVNEFLTWRAQACSPGSIMVAATGLRALLRWMFLTGLLDQQLASAVGPVRYRPGAGLPKFLAAGEVAALLAADMSRRDRAVLLLLARPSKARTPRAVRSGDMLKVQFHSRRSFPAQALSSWDTRPGVRSSRAAASRTEKPSRASRATAAAVWAIRVSSS